MSTNLETQITLGQINNMKHCIGFTNKKIKRGKYETYRNYYTTCGDNENWDKLVELGLAGKRNSRMAGDFTKVYWVTKEGMEFLGELLGCKIGEME